MGLTRTELTKTLALELGLTRRQAREVLSAFLGAIVSALSSGDVVGLRGFGRFLVTQATSRSSQEVGTVLRPPRRTVRFKCSPILRAAMSTVHAAGQPTPAWNSILEQLLRNLECSDRVQKTLEDHERWIESEGEEGQRADLSICDLKGIDLFGVNLRVSDLSAADLAGADLSDADLESANLEDANLTRASLAWAKMRGANLQGACLKETDLRWADLRWANLRNADLRHANLAGAYLNDAVLAGADLTGARLKNTHFEASGPEMTPALGSSLPERMISLALRRSRRRKLFN